MVDVCWIGQIAQCDPDHSATATVEDNARGVGCTQGGKNEEDSPARYCYRIIGIYSGSSSARRFPAGYRDGPGRNFDMQWAIGTGSVCTSATMDNDAQVHGTARPIGSTSDIAGSGRRRF